MRLYILCNESRVHLVLVVLFVKLELVEHSVQTVEMTRITAIVKTLDVVFPSFVRVLDQRSA